MPAYDIPNGPLNLKALFPTIEFRDVEEYYVTLRNSTGDVIATTTRNWLVGCCDDEKVSIFFLNSMGGIDMVNGLRKNADMEVKSESYVEPLTVPHEVMTGGKRRSRIVAGDVLEVVVKDYSEFEATWLKELGIAPLIWLGIGQQYVPAVLEDGTFPVVKEEDRFHHHIDLVFRLSNDLQTQRT